MWHRPCSSAVRWSQLRLASSLQNVRVVASLAHASSIPFQQHRQRCRQWLGAAQRVRLLHSSPASMLASGGGGNEGSGKQPQLNVSLLDNPALKQRLEQLLKAHDMLQKEFDELVSTNGSSEDIANKSIRLAKSADLVAAVKEWREREKELEELEQLLEDDDSDIRALAEADIGSCRQSILTLKARVLALLVPEDSADAGNAMLEVRPGAGGREAALFAADLFKMYSNYCVNRGWKFQELSLQTTDDGGFKEATASVTGTNVFGCLKLENGVHRVQRVPTTEAAGRIHTSTAVVSILPQPREVDVQVHERDIKMDTFRAGGAGGQHVNTTDSAVRLTHIPTGVIVSCQTERSQHQNKAVAMRILKAKIFAAERERLEEERKKAKSDLMGGATGQRSDKIRTYNFPQDRITDHRINKRINGMDAFLSGGDTLQEMIDDLRQFDNAERLASFIDGGD